MKPIWLVLCLSACLGGKRPNYDYFVLTPTTTRPASPTAGAGTVAVNRVTIPAYLDRESIVTRAGDYQIVYSKQERWAEPLDDALTRILRQNLATSLASTGITVPSHTNAPTYDVDVDILRFERRGTDRVELWARWTLRTNEGSPQTHEARVQVRIARPTSAAAAAALSHAVADLASRIAARVQVAAAAHAKTPDGA